MDIRVVNKNFAVAPQIAVDDIAAVKELGYVAVINNRPDGEVEGQPLTADIRSKALEAGLDYYDLPIISGTLPPDAIAATKSLLSDINGPAFAFCRSGTRSITLWALSQNGERPAAEIINDVQQAGYDLPFLENILTD